MGDPVQGIINNDEWRKEKLDFICSVVTNVNQESLLSELGFCETDEDAEGLMQSLILLQDKEEILPQNDLALQQQRLNVHYPQDIIVRLPEEHEEEPVAQAEPVVLQPQELDQDDPRQEGAESEGQAEGSDSDDSCYFTPDIFSSQTEQAEGEEIPEASKNTLLENDGNEESEFASELAQAISESTELVGATAEAQAECDKAEKKVMTSNNIRQENDDNEESEFAAELAQAIAESTELAGATAQAQAECDEAEQKVMTQVAILSDLFSDADPDFLQGILDKCIKLEGEEEAFHILYEECLEINNYPTMKDLYKKKNQTTVAASESIEDFVIIDPEAVAENLITECGICLEENMLGIDTNSCSAFKNEHTYCNNCIKRYVEAQIGQGLTMFKCMEGYCDAEFSLRMLQRLIEPTVFAKICERRQQEEITAAGVENLECCPFCNYMVSMPNEEDKIFKCWNPECMIDSCRKCKEPNHIPLRCEEVEKKGQRNARTFLENEMAEAMIRECPRCKKRFIIEAGCNRMTCPCGAVMCYVCKQLIDTGNGDGYSHFERGPGPSEKCPLHSNSSALHEEEVRNAAQRAKQELDPEVTLVHDPTNDVL